jgi:hypothetical protein
MYGGRADDCKMNTKRPLCVSENCDNFRFQVPCETLEEHFLSASEWKTQYIRVTDVIIRGKFIQFSWKLIYF